MSGVDIKQQKHYPFKFWRENALDVLSNNSDIDLNQFDFIHASPPCQTHTRLTHMRDAQGGKTRVIDILDETVDLCLKTGKPFVVENVNEAKLDPKYDSLTEIVLCGSMFGLKVRRHRKFWSNIPLKNDMKCDHKTQGKPIGVYGSKNDQLKGVGKDGRIVYGGKTAATLEEGIEAMGFNRTIPWCKLIEAIPPAYSKFIGEQIIEFIKKK